MKARIDENNEIKVYSNLPNVWKNHINFQEADATLYQSEGFYEIEEPSYNSVTQKLGDIYFDDEYDVFTYPVINKTQAEIDYETAMAGWHHPEFEKRIVAPSALVNNYPEIGVHMWVNKLPVETSADGSTLYLYMNVIRPEHQALVDALQGMITIENIPILTEP